MGSLFGGDKAAKKAAKRAAAEAKAERERNAAEQERVKAEEAARAGRIQQGEQVVGDWYSQFDPAFYAQREQDYIDFAKPQVEQQAERAKKDLTFSLARQFGTLDSSVAAEKEAELAAAKTAALGDVADTAAGYSKQARDRVENERKALLLQAKATADPISVAQVSQGTGEAIRAPDQYNQVANLFGNVTEGLAASTYPDSLVGWDKMTTPVGKIAAAGAKPKGGSYQNYFG